MPEIKLPVMKMRADGIEREPQDAHDDRDDQKRIAEPAAHQKREDQPERRSQNDGEHALRHDALRVRREIELKGKMIVFVQFVFYHSNRVNEKRRSVNRNLCFLRWGVRLFRLPDDKKKTALSDGRFFGGGESRTPVLKRVAGASTGLAARGGCRDPVAAPQASVPYPGCFSLPPFRPSGR